MSHRFTTKEKAAGQRAMDFFTRKIRHVKGEFAGKPFKVEKWQERFIRNVFGRLRPDGTRQYRTVYLEVPRKNGKTFLAAGCALYLLLSDAEPAPEIYSAAGDRGQARLVFEACREMIRQDSRLSLETELYQHRILGKANGGFYAALSAEAYSKHGLNAHGIIFDELHVQPDRELWDVLVTSMGARRQPLTIAITTAGYDRQSICWELHKRALRAIENPENDPTFYGMIYSADPEDDWQDEKVWHKANPNLGVSVKLEYLREQAAIAKDNPAYENTFRQLHLNQWTQQAVRAIPMHLWDKASQPIDVESLKGEPCWAGLDLASTRDIAALVLCFPRENDEYIILPRFFVPEDIAPRVEADRRDFAGWITEGLIHATSGNETDYATIQDQFRQDCETYDVRGLAFDPWNASKLIQDITEEGYPQDLVVKYPQTVTHFAEPTAKMLTLIKTFKFKHGGNPVLRWMAGNLAVKVDPSGNMRPDKAKSADKIDGIVAGIMALDGAMRGQSAMDSVYDSRGLSFI